MNVAIDAMLLRRPYTGVQRYIAGLIRAISTYVPDVTLTAYIGRDHDGNFPEAETLRVRKAWIKNSWRPLRILWEQIVLPFRVRAAGADIFQSSLLRLLRQVGICHQSTAHRHDICLA